MSSLSKHSYSAKYSGDTKHSHPACEHSSSTHAPHPDSQHATKVPSSIQVFHHGRDAVPLLTPREGVPEVTHDDIEHVIERLSAGHGAFAVDTERASGIRYSDRAYLIQIRRPGAGSFLIDPIGIEHRLKGLASIMREEWILHAADQDLPAMHELGLFPTKVFDTEIAALLLGFEKVSLQAIAAEVLGQALAKEYSHSDWSVRPLNKDLRTYAALDVELLHELKDALIGMLERSHRLEWCEQECEYVRLQPPRPPKKQPWRKAARRANIKDRRALAMAQKLWDMRDQLARERDVCASSVLPNDVLGELARRKPRSQADVLHSPLMRSRARRMDVEHWWHAINEAWHMRGSDLPERRFAEKESLFPPVKRWAHSHPEEAERWNFVRSAIVTWADELGIRQEVLLKPQLQKQLSWEGWANASDFSEKLHQWGARPWQIEQVRKAVLHI